MKLRADSRLGLRAFGPRQAGVAPNSRTVGCARFLERD